MNLFEFEKELLFNDKFKILVRNRWQLYDQTNHTSACWKIISFDARRTIGFEWGKLIHTPKAKFCYITHHNVCK